MSLLVLLLLALFAGVPGFGSSESGSGEGWTEYGPAPEPTGRAFILDGGDFVTYPPGKVKPGDMIACAIDGKVIDALVPKPGVGVSVDPLYIETKSNGAVRVECGGIHAETAPPGSW